MSLKRTIFTISLLIGILSGAMAQKNPFITHMYTADPSAHVWSDGRLYVYASHDIAPPKGCDLMDQYHVFSTDDMVNWTDHGEILRASQVPWGRKEGGFMWAPDCVFRNGTYYFYFPHPNGTKWNSTWKIGVATSKNPASGFKVQGYIPDIDPMIDPCVFIDDDGQAYFYHGGGGTCKAGKLKENMMEIDGEMKIMTGLFDFHEATWINKRNGTYYLSYSDNNDVAGKHNQMRYATSNSPLGPWTHRGIYMDPTDSFTNHGSIVEYKGQWYAFYHNSSISNHDWLRSVCADKLYFNPDGTIQKVIQTKAEKSDLIATKSSAYKFNKTISREVLENYLDRSITIQSLLIGRGNFDDNLRMIKNIKPKFIGRAVCQWGGEADMIKNFELEKGLILKVHQIDPEIILQACVFEIVTEQVNQVPVPDWAFKALGMKVEQRNFRYADMLYPGGQFKNHWGKGSVPDVSRPETKLYFFYQSAAYINLGIEAIHFGQVELMNKNDKNLDYYSQLLDLIRVYAKKYARRGMLICDAHVPGGGFLRDGKLLMDFHSFPLRIMEVSGKPEEAVLQVGYTDALFNRSKGGITYSGWKCDHLPYLVEFDNFGVSKFPGKEKAGEIPFWVWGYDEISWFAHQEQKYRHYWLKYTYDWLRETDLNGFLEMPGGRQTTSPIDKKRWYAANNLSETVPNGHGDEDVIRDIWVNGRTAFRTVKK